MDVPRVDPIGLSEVPGAFSQTPRRHSRATRAMTTVLIGIFVGVSSVTTAVSLGAYCLTTDGANTAAIPGYPHSARRAR